MHCMLKVQTKKVVSDVLPMLSVSANAAEKTMKYTQIILERKAEVNMQHYMENQMHADATCISMPSRLGIFVHNVLFEALQMMISNTLKIILQAKWMLNVYIVMPFAGRVRSVPFVVVVAKCNYQFIWIRRNR